MGDQWFVRLRRATRWLTRAIAYLALASMLAPAARALPVLARTEHHIRHHRISVTGVSHGLRITLSVRQRSYPQDALINARVRIKNISDHLITAPGTSCTQMDPWVEDLSKQGTVLFPDGVKWLNLIPDCGATTEDTWMTPGYDVLYYNRYVVAKGPVLRAIMDVRESAGVATGNVPAMSPPLRLKLGPRRPSKVRITREPRLSARIRPSFRHGPQMVYLSLDHCYKGSAPYDYLGVFWTYATHRMIKPECPHPSGWRVIVGWYGRSAAFIDYGR